MLCQEGSYNIIILYHHKSAMHAEIFIITLSACITLKSILLISDTTTFFFILVLYIGDLFNGTAQYDEEKEHFLNLLP